MRSTTVVALRTNAETKTEMNVENGSVGAKGEMTVIPRRASVHENRLVDLADQEVDHRVQASLEIIIMITTTTMTVSDLITKDWI